MLLGRPGMSLRGKKAGLLFDYETLLARNKEVGMATDPVTLSCHVNPDLMVRAAPLFSSGGEWTETVVMVSEPQRIRSRYDAKALGGKRTQSGAVPGFEHVQYASPVMEQTVRKAASVGRTPSTVLITGESGTGKELFARGIHKSGPRADGPFVAVNCGAISPELVQSELFGYAPGAFTGADRKGRMGKFEEAGGGVLFLDEISEMPLAMQVNLLRALEEREVVRVGESRPRPVDVKVVAATNKDLASLVQEGRFREDLFYRINVVGLHIPPLRERAGDVELLALHHAKRLAREFGQRLEGIDPQALAAMRGHGWPGNVRELVNCVEYAVNTMRGGVIRVEDLPGSIAPQKPRPVEQPQDTVIIPSRSGECGFKLQAVEAETIREALRFHGGNISKTAKALGIGRNTLYTKLEKFNIAV
jgi:transcriptional regulator with PAS, ATPase and Fis domain